MEMATWRHTHTHIHHLPGDNSRWVYLMDLFQFTDSEKKIKSHKLVKVLKSIYLTYTKSWWNKICFEENKSLTCHVISSRRQRTHTHSSEEWTETGSRTCYLVKASLMSNLPPVPFAHRSAAAHMMRNVSESEQPSPCDVLIFWQVRHWNQLLI